MDLIRNACSQLLVLLTDPQKTAELRLLRLGVNGLLTRNATLPEVRDTVGTVLTRGRCYDENVLDLLQRQLDRCTKFKWGGQEFSEQ